MNKYKLSRIGWAVLSVFAILTVNFFVTRLMPGDPVAALVGEFPTPPGYVDEIRVRLGLDLPLYIQFFRYIRAVFQGDLGYSFVSMQPVATLLLEKARWTLLLMIPSLLIASVAGVLLALWVAPVAGKPRDNAVTAVSLFFYSIPVFWFGQILILVFAINLGWLPAQGMVSLRAGNMDLFARLVDVLRHMALPIFCLATTYSAIVVRVARASVIGILREDFVVTARAKGLSQREVLFHHILPNAAIPIVMVIAYNFGYSLTGSIFVETVFSWPGLGSAFLSSITSRDYPVLQGLFLFSSVVVVLANIAADLISASIDPRVKRSVSGEA
jgi:peptide/nickel transport system permease protein